LIKRVYAYVAHRVGMGPDAEDITSSVFENAFRYRSTYDANRGEPVTWVLGIARRCVAKALAERVELAAEPPETEAPGDLEADAVRRVMMQAALRNLNERERDLIALRYGADLDARQIAQLLGSTTNAVEVALHRARARLRAELEASARDEEAVSGPAGDPP
jgi:RNA polymerase sigma-70 factor (ECF subfamily)